ncbi:hypothetical protein [Sphingobium sp. YR768]|uniref:hypothetical protein n=1 Tax=Sphingobium sp. YR768 TaxID=1884365 RepID=UPI00116008D8|nr:hypothetical protein [Sphingobium sp. YR768]
MRFPAIALIALMGLHTTSPAASVRQPDAEIGCAPTAKTEHAQSGAGSPQSAAAASTQERIACDIGDGPAQADLQIYGLFLLGMLIIGIPAIRRRQARVVFS